MDYFGGIHRQTSSAKEDERFVCGSCGTRRVARANVTDTAIAHSPFYLGMGSAETRAAVTAQANASNLAVELLAIVPCPVCGVRRPKEARTFVRASIANGVSLALAFLVVMFGFVWAGLAPLAVVAGVGAVFAPAGYALFRAQLWRRAASAVVFFEGQAPDAPFTGKRCAVCEERIVLASQGLRCWTCGVPVHGNKCRKRHERVAGHDAVP